MRLSLFACSALILCFGVAGCDQSSQTRPPTQADAQQGAPGQAIWSAATAKQLKAALEGRAAHGLDRMTFGALGEPGSPETDAALTKAALAYASALAKGATDPGKFYAVYTLDRPKPDLEGGLRQALADRNVDVWLRGLAPRDDNYRKLSESYLALRSQPASQASASPAIAEEGQPIKIGAVDQRVPAIAAQLVAFDYLPSSAAQGNRYSPAMVAAVRRMQADYGIEPDGVIGADALQILNLSDADRARAIAVNMERLRWLGRDAPGTRIDVNLAAARLIYWRDGKIANVRKVVVGAPDTETPQLASPIFRLVANPTWTVPKSIESKELADKGADYLQANNMVRKDGFIVQQPGPKNSLGLVKFDMKNEHAIYLHDTPAKQLFGEVERQRSHGCVRVEDALGFAEMVARDEGVLEQWQNARATGEETFVSLPTEIPVRLLYQTVLFDAQGQPVVRSDPYGWNEPVAAALGFTARDGRRLKTAGADVGP